MKVQFSSLVHAPVSLPVWQTILDDLGEAPAHRVAKVLGMRSVGTRSVVQPSPRAVRLTAPTMGWRPLPPVAARRTLGW